MFLYFFLVFAVGETYATLLMARAVQGIGSACIGVCGMSLVAQVSLDVSQNLGMNIHILCIYACIYKFV